MTATTVPTTDATSRPATWPIERLGGIGGLVFVTVVIVQNVIRATAAPAGDASTAEIIEFFQNERGVVQLLGALFALNVPMLFVFTAALIHRADRTVGRGGWSTVGLIGVTGVAAVFSLIVITEVAGVAIGDGIEASTADLLWAVNGAAFGLNMAMLATALAGLGLTAVRAGLMPTWFRPVALGAATLGLVSAANSVSIAEGTMAAAGPGLLAFITWLAFLVVTSFRMLTAPRS